MWQFSNEHQSPSLIIESMSWPLPMRSPSRTRGSRYGALLIDSIPPGDGDLDVAGRDALGGKHDGLEAGAAHLVDRQRRDMVAEAAVERSLAGRILAVARLDDVAHDALVDERRIDPGARDRLADDQRAQLRGREVLEAAEKLSGRCANGRENDGLIHRVLIFVMTSAPSKCWSFGRIAGRARSISFSHRSSLAMTCNVVPFISTDVIRASVDPTTSCHANAVRAGEDGWRRTISARTPPENP